jgi:hypothetical protein
MAKVCPAFASESRVRAIADEPGSWAWCGRWVWWQILDDDVLLAEFDSTVGPCFRVFYQSCLAGVPILAVDTAVGPEVAVWTAHREEADSIEA